MRLDVKVLEGQLNDVVLLDADQPLAVVVVVVHVRVVRGHDRSARRGQEAAAAARLRLEGGREALAGDGGVRVEADNEVVARRGDRLVGVRLGAELDQLGRGDVGTAVDDEAVVVAVRVALEVVLQDVELDAR